MKKIKPDVIGCMQISFDGVFDHYSISNYIWNKNEMKEVCEFDFELTNVKSKFRPAYKKED